MPDRRDAPSIGRIVGEWGRIGCLGFGGPPTHIAMLRELTVERERWLAADEFADALGACNILPGPASTQLAIYCAWRLRGPAGAIAGGLSFILPGLVAIVLLSVLFLAASPPTWVRGAGAGAGAAVPAVALLAATRLAPPSWRQREARRLFWALAFAAGAVGTVTAGAGIVIVLLAAGFAGVAAQRAARGPAAAAVVPFAVNGAVGGSLAWTALKVGALSFGGGFVIVPLMRADAVDVHHWMTSAQFLNAVALGQLTPGPVVQTVAAVGYAAAGLGGALAAAAIAFAPSFAFVLAGARRFDRLRSNSDVGAFMSGATPAAIGAIVGAAALLAGDLRHGWQIGVLLAAAASLAVRGRVVITLLASGLAGALLAVAGVSVT
jgi:chromate transporter